MATTFVHLTDLHIQPADADRFLGQDTMEHLRETLALLRQRGLVPGTPIIISGDLANNGEAESYARLRPVIEEMRGWGAPVLLALGNHDNRAVFRTVMLDEPANDGRQEYAYRAMFDGLRLLVLDSTMPGTHAGAIGAAQLAWLKDELATPAPEGTVIVVHHPPTAAPIPGLEGHMLTDAEALIGAIAGSDVIGILSEHVHLTATSLVAGVPCVTAPGTAFLLDACASEGMRFLSGGGFNLVTVRNGMMEVLPVALPRAQTELYYRAPQPEAVAAVESGQVATA